jgi:predicted MPP superfamily phosphohydrolase
MKTQLYYTIQESYKGGEKVNVISMYDLEKINDVEKNIDSRIRMYTDNDFKIARNGNDLIIVSHNPDFDLHIVKFKEYK